MSQSNITTNTDLAGHAVRTMNSGKFARIKKTKKNMLMLDRRPAKLIQGNRISNFFVFTSPFVSVCP